MFNGWYTKLICFTEGYKSSYTGEQKKYSGKISVLPNDASSVTGDVALSVEYMCCKKTVIEL